MTSEMVEKLRYGKNVESWWELGAQAADELERLTSAIERKDAALRKLDEALTCRRDDDAHYCPNCDNSLYSAREIARAALEPTK